MPTMPTIYTNPAAVRELEAEIKRILDAKLPPEWEFYPAGKGGGMYVNFKPKGYGANIYCHPLWEGDLNFTMVLNNEDGEVAHQCTMMFPWAGNPTVDADLWATMILICLPAFRMMLEA